MLRRIIIALVFCIAWSAGAQAQATFDPNRKNAGITLSNGNLTAKNTAGADGFISVMTLPTFASGKICAEFINDAWAATTMQGVGDGSANTASYMGADAHSDGYEDNNAWLDNGVSNAGHWSPPLANADTAQVCFDIGAAKSWAMSWTSGGGCSTWSNTGNPATGAGGEAIRPAQPITFGTTLFLHNVAQVTLNPHSATFKCAIPSGFVDLAGGSESGLLIHGCCS